MTRYTGGATLAVIVAAVLAWATASRQVDAQGWPDWDITSMLESMQAGGEETMTERGAQESSDGQNVNGGSSRRRASDGSVRENEQSCGNGNYTNPGTKDARWYEDGSVSSLSREYDRDAAGNWTRHTVETTVAKDGNRTMTTYDDKLEGGRWTPGKKDVKRDTVAPPNPRSCEKAYWTGTVTATLSLDLASSNSTDDNRPGGTGHDMRTQSSMKHTVRDVTTVVLLPPDPLRPENTKNAIVTRDVKDDTIATNVSTQEIFCDGSYKPWKHDNSSSIRDHASGSKRDSAGVRVQADGAYSITFSSFYVEGTNIFTQSDYISPGKCWGSNNEPGSPITAKSNWWGRSFEAKGRVDPKQANSLSGVQTSQSGQTVEKIVWNLTRFDPARRGRQ